jgi:hypothetical protein
MERHGACPAGVGSSGHQDAKVSQGSGTPGVLSGPMPRWFFLLVVIALGLSVAGGIMIFLRSPTPVAQKVD